MSLQTTIRNSINSFIRFVNNLRRPSKSRNLRLQRERGETTDSYTIREATAADIPALAVLHVKTWNDTYGGSGVTVNIRQHQWREQFSKKNDTWFVLLVEDHAKQLIGFAKGQYNPADMMGELNKIYLLRDYQRIGIGSRLVGEVARRLLRMGVNDMLLFGIPQNPSCHFHEKLGGERMTNKGEVFQGGYHWHDLHALAKL
jgi:GNAT superfamily N-acetyltransferase